MLNINDNPYKRGDSLEPMKKNMENTFGKGVFREAAPKQENLIDGESYYAQAVLAEDGRNCYFEVLDENKKPFIEPGTGKPLGIYENSSSAGVDVINLRREKKGIKEKVKTLRGTTYWINEDGLSIKDLIDKCQRC